ncbi:MAG: VWA domain-containing protein [Chitinophagales bacterium]
MELTFAHPKFLFLLALVPLFVFYFIYNRKRSSAAFSLPSLQGLSAVGPGLKAKLLPVLPVLRTLGFIALVIALARPQKSLSEKEVTTEGIDIVLSIDVSGSMLALDLKPDRLEASKNVAKEFIEGRPTDRIGLVVFAGESFTQCPITTDHSVLLNLFEDVKSGLIEDGTAIGMGLATAISRLKESEAKSKVVILMTDGVNNAGYIDPLTAVELAKAEGIRVYTVGVGSRGTAPYPYRDAFGRTMYQNIEVQIDEELLQKIATETGGEYFRATNNEKLKEIYEAIDQLEKSKINVASFESKSEHFFLFAFMALIAFALEVLIRNTFLRKLI